VRIILLLLFVSNFVKFSYSQHNICCNHVITDLGVDFCSNASEFNMTCFSLAERVICSGVVNHIERPGNFNSILCKKTEDENTTFMNIKNETHHFSFSNNCKNCLREKCSGNGLYCQRHSCRSNSKCFCQEFDMQTVPMINDKGTWKDTDRVIVTCDRLVQRTVEELEKRDLDQGPSEFSITWNQPEILVYSQQVNGSIILVNKNTYSMEIGMTSVNQKIRIPDHWLVSPEPIIVRLYWNLALVDTESLDVKVLSGCEVEATCTFCLKNFSCKEWWVQMIIVLIIVILLTVTGVLLYVIIKFLLNCVSGVQPVQLQMSPMVTLLFFFKLCAASNFNLIDEYNMMKVPLSILSLMSLNKFRVNKTIKVFLVMLILVWSVDAQSKAPTRSPTRAPTSIPVSTNIPLAQKCDQSVQVSSDEIICTRNLTAESCTITSQVLATLPFPGTTICYVLMNEKDDAVLGHIEVGYVKSEIIAQTILQYWTSSWAVTTKSETDCPNSNYCDGDNNCGIFNTLSHTDPNYLKCWGDCDGLCSLYPGQSYCMSSCGCAGCGCFFCSDACTYGRWGIAPSPDVTAVYKIGNFLRFPTLQICYVDTLGIRKCYVKRVESSTAIQFSDDFSVTTLGSLAAGSIQTPAQYVIRRHDNLFKWFGDACDVNVPCPGNVGDIQSSTSGGLFNPTPSSFAFPPNLFIPTVQGHTMTFTGPLPGLQIKRPTLDNLQLPLYANSVNWDLDSTLNLVGAELNPGVLLIAIDAENMKFTRVINEICPEIELLAVKGKFSETKGAWFEINALSTCLQGSCILSGNGITLNTPSLNLTYNIKKYIVYFTSSVKSIKGVVTCTAGKHTDSFQFSATLEDPEIDIVTNNTQSVTTGNAFKDWWFGLEIAAQVGFAIGMSIVLAIIVAGLIVAAVAVGYFGWGSGLGNMIRYSKIVDGTQNLNESSEVELSEPEDDAF